MEFIAKIYQKHHYWTNDVLFNAWAETQPDGAYTHKITRIKQNMKTNPQLGYYFICVELIKTAMIKQGNDSVVVQVGEYRVHLPLTKESVDGMLKQRFAASKGLAEFSKKFAEKFEMGEFIDWMIMWAAKFLSCVIPPPDTGDQK